MWDSHPQHRVFWSKRSDSAEVKKACFKERRAPGAAGGRGGGELVFPGRQEDSLTAKQPGLAWCWERERRKKLCRI